MGTLFSAGYETAISWHKELLASRRVKKREALGEAGFISERLISHYSITGRMDSLYTSVKIEPFARIPLLHDREISFPVSIDSQSDSVFILSSEKLDLPFNPSLLKREVRRGARIFEGEILHLEGMRITPHETPEFTFSRCNYSAYATLTLTLRKEIYSRFSRRRILNGYLLSFSDSISGGIIPQAMGCSCVSLFRDQAGKVHIAIAKRSTEVLNGHNLRGVVPNFGSEAHTLARRKSKYSLILYNYLKEFVEEFYDLEEVVTSASARRADPDWVFHLPESLSLIDQVNSGNVQLACLGMAVNPVDGALNFAISAEFSSPEFFENLRYSVKSNWEFDSRFPGSSPIEFIELDSDLIDEWANRGEIDPVSVFAIDLARVRFGSS